MSFKNRKVFTHRLQKYIVQSSLTEITVVAESNLQIVDVLQTSHPAEILCIDVAEQTKDIVSYSHLVLPDHGEVSKHLIVHALEDQSYLLGVDSKVTADYLATHKDVQYFAAR